MLRILLGLVLVGAGFAVIQGCGGDSDDSKSPAAASCEKRCQTAATVTCTSNMPATCVSDCETAYDKQVAQKAACEPQVKAYFECFAATPASDWACDVDNKASIKDGVCKTEVDAIVACRK